MIESKIWRGIDHEGFFNHHGCRARTFSGRGGLPAKVLTFCGSLLPGRDWRRAFPGNSKQEIRQFLSLFIKAFGFSEKEKLKLNPEDKILGIYQKLYPIKGMPDGLELETLDRDLLKNYGLQLRTIWNEQMTLGKLFAECAAAKLRS